MSYQSRSKDLHVFFCMMLIVIEEISVISTGYWGFVAVAWYLSGLNTIRVALQHGAVTDTWQKKALGIGLAMVGGSFLMFIVTAPGMLVPKAKKDQKTVKHYMQSFLKAFTETVVSVIIAACSLITGILVFQQLHSHEVLRWIVSVWALGVVGLMLGMIQGTIRMYRNMGPSDPKPPNIYYLIYGLAVVAWPILLGSAPFLKRLQASKLTA